MKPLHLPALDGLRGVAVLLVVALHYWQMSFCTLPAPLEPFIRCGFLGVDLFFFLSGLVLTLNPFELTDFIKRRAAKIVPSYWLCILTLELLHYQDSMIPGTGTFNATDILTHLLFIQNWWLSTEGAINGVLWSLATEVQFYVLFPLIMLGFIRWTGPTVLAMFLVANLVRFLAPSSSLGLTLHNTLALLDFFGAGMLTAVLYHRIHLNLWQGMSLFIVGGASCLCLMVHLYHWPSLIWPNDWFRYYGSALSISLLVMTLGLLHAGLLQKLFDNAPLRFFGAISYNLYLWHKVVGYYLVWHLGDPHLASTWKQVFPLVAFGISCFLATILTRYFEEPLRRKIVLCGK